ncbi:MAG: DUF4376 domain-containing protein, partial [Candidatus Thorarchaeota archaeon]
EWVYDSEKEAACLIQAKASLRSRINAHRKYQLAKGMPYGDEQYIQADELSRMNIQDAVSISLEYPLPWKTWDQTIFLLNCKEDLVAMRDAMTLWVQKVFADSFIEDTNLQRAATEKEAISIVETYESKYS